MIVGAFQSYPLMDDHDLKIDHDHGQHRQVRRPDVRGCPAWAGPPPGPVGLASACWCRSA